MRASGPVTAVALGPFLASGVYTGPGATRTDAALPLSHAEPAHQDVYFGPKKRPLGEGRLASPGRAGGRAGSWSLGPGCGSDLFYVRMTRATEEAALPKQRLKHLGKCAASSFPRDSYSILPAPLGEVGLGTAEGRGAPGGKERVLPLPAPRSISLGTLTIHPRAPELRLSPSPPRAALGTGHKPTSQMGRQGPGWGCGRF